ncbi:ATP-binding cassette domain-containing protein, partial [Rhizobium leguminosarum]
MQPVTSWPSIIGPNGAGKSTVFKAIFGLLDIHSGQVLLD